MVRFSWTASDFVACAEAACEAHKENASSGTKEKRMKEDIILACRGGRLFLSAATALRSPAVCERFCFPFWGGLERSAYSTSSPTLAADLIDSLTKC